MRLYLTRLKDKGNWYIRGTDREGRKVFESTKTAHKAAAEALRIKREGNLLNESVFGKKAVVTFDEAVESYIQSGGSKRFLGHFDPVTGKMHGLVGKFEGVPLRTITPAMLDKVSLEMLPNVKPETRNRQVHTPFIAVWNHAVDNDWADPRKWSRPKKPKGTNVEDIRPLRAGTKATEYEQAARFILAMSPANAIVMTILFYTGMRPIELFSMHAEQVNVKDRWITLPKSKTGDPRGVPVHEVLVPLLTALVKRGGKVVRTWRGKPFTIVEGNGGQMKKAMSQARSRTGITGISPYTARHTVSTQLVVNLVHPHIKDQIIGHAVGDDMSRHYTQVPQPKLTEAINTLPVIPEWKAAPWMSDPIAYQAGRIKPLSPAKKAVLYVKNA